MGPHRMRWAVTTLTVLALLWPAGPAAAQNQSLEEVVAPGFEQ